MGSEARSVMFRIDQRCLSLSADISISMAAAGPPRPEPLNRHVHGGKTRKRSGKNTVILNLLQSVRRKVIRDPEKRERGA